MGLRGNLAEITWEGRCMTAEEVKALYRKIYPDLKVLPFVRENVPEK
jgi:hypothetical protein